MALWDAKTELNLLAGLLVHDGESVGKVIAVLKESDFYRPEHALMFRHIVKVWESGQTPNLITLRDSLKKDGKLNPANADLLLALGKLHFTDAYVEQDAQIVKEKANQRRLVELAEYIKQETESDKKTVPTLLQELEDTAQNIKNQTSVSDISNLFPSQGYFKNQLDAEISAARKYADRKTGFTNLDNEQIFTSGLYVIGGLPALGKTTFAWQLMNQLAANGEKCIYCSYEMSRLELFMKTVASEMYKSDRNTTLTAMQMLRGGRSLLMDNVVGRLQERQDDISVLELRDESVDEILRILRRFCVHTEKSPVVCLDYLQIIPHSYENARTGIDEIVRKLKNFQRATDTTFIVISSFNRLNYLQTVSFECFKESGNIEYTADVVWGLQLDCMNTLPVNNVNKAREQIEQAKRDIPRRVQLRCLKNRKGNNYDCAFDYYAMHDYFEVAVDSGSACYNLDVPVDDDDEDVSDWAD